jgi:hypothetical protein
MNMCIEYYFRYYINITQIFSYCHTDNNIPTSAVYWVGRDGDKKIIK